MADIINPFWKLVECGEVRDFDDYHCENPEYQIVGQGFGELSSHRRQISSGFSQCSGFLLVNDKTKEVMLLHLDQWPDLRHSEWAHRQKLIERRLDPYFAHMESIGANVTLIPLMAEHSNRPASLITDIYGDRIAHVAKTTLIPNGNYHLDIAHDPEKGWTYFRFKVSGKYKYLKAQFYDPTHLVQPDLSSSLEEQFRKDDIAFRYADDLRTALKSPNLKQLQRVCEAIQADKDVVLAETLDVFAKYFPEDIGLIERGYYTFYRFDKAGEIENYAACMDYFAEHLPPERQAAFREEAVFSTANIARQLYERSALEACLAHAKKLADGFIPKREDVAEALTDISQRLERFER